MRTDGRRVIGEGAGVSELNLQWATRHRCRDRSARNRSAAEHMHTTSRGVSTPWYLVFGIWYVVFDQGQKRWLAGPCMHESKPRHLLGETAGGHSYNMESQFIIYFIIYLVCCFFRLLLYCCTEITQARLPHVVEVHEGVVYGHDLNLLIGMARAKHHSPDPAKAIDADLDGSSHPLLFLF